MYNIVLQSTSQHHMVYVVKRHYQPIKFINSFIQCIWFGENYISTVNICSQIRQWKTGVLYCRQHSRTESKLQDECSYSFVYVFLYRLTKKYTRSIVYMNIQLKSVKESVLYKCHTFGKDIILLPKLTFKFYFIFP